MRGAHLLDDLADLLTPVVARWQLPGLLDRSQLLDAVGQIAGRQISGLSDRPRRQGVLGLGRLSEVDRDATHLLDELHQLDELAGLCCQLLEGVAVHG